MMIDVDAISKGNGILTLYRGIKDLSNEESEELAAFLTENMHLFDRIRPVKRTNTDKKSKNGWKLVPYREKNSKRRGKPVSPNYDAKYEEKGEHLQNEDYVAMQLFNQSHTGEKIKPLETIGYVLDYQMPIGGTLEYLLGNEGGIMVPDKNNELTLYKPGKCDLVSYNPDNNTFYILELKDEDSHEPILGAAIEAYTYLKLLDHEAVLKNMQDIYKDEGVIIRDDAKFVAAPLIFEGSNPYNEYKNVYDYTQTRKLIDEALQEHMMVWNWDHVKNEIVIDRA